MDIPGFKIERTIGKGGMGTVYRAIQESLGRLVVLKTMNMDRVQTTEFVERFLNEGRMIASLRHPHIITIYDIGASEDIVYISMEYVEGGDLKRKIRQSVSPEDALALVSRVASALELAHSKGIIHRDVKPANILYRGDGTPLLSDFGIAKQIQVDNELTSTGTILGSPFYMSPEQAEGLPVDGRTDIYSLGVIFHEMLVGEKPYLGDSPIKVIMQHLQSPIPRLPPELHRYQPLLDAMMKKDREQRIPDAGTVVREVEELRRLEIAAPHAVELPETVAAKDPRPRDFNRRSKIQYLPESPREWALSASVVLLAVSFLAFYLYTESLKNSGLVKPKPALADAASLTLSPSPPGPAVPADAVPSRSPAMAPQATDQGPARPADPTAGAANTASPSEAGPSRDNVIGALEWLAHHSLNEDRLTSPPSDNAHYYYQRLLALDPGNEKALKGFSEIAERYVVLAEKEFAQRNYDNAQNFIRMGLQIEPDNEGLLALQQFIQNREDTFLESVVKFFKGRG